MATIDKDSKWKGLVPKVLDHRKRKSVKRREWRDFDDLECDILFDLADNGKSYEDIQNEHNLKDAIRKGSKSFILKCISSSLTNGKENAEEKFFPLFMIIDKMISRRDILVKKLTRASIFVSALFAIIDEGDCESLMMVLEKLTEHHKLLKDNNNVLVMACRKDKLELVLPLVSVGYRYVINNWSLIQIDFGIMFRIAIECLQNSYSIA